jgi:hypothetical protein
MQTKVSNDLLDEHRYFEIALPLHLVSLAGKLSQVKSG